MCRFASCTHTHEGGCAVLKGLEDRMISTSRYHSYLGLLEGRDAEKVLEREKDNPRKARR
jgi:ribosome biogenesis GTPase